MIHYKKVLVATKCAITCDICGKTYSEDDVFELGEFTHIEHNAGYESIFGDGESFEIDICQHCLRDHLGKYLRRR